MQQQRDIMVLTCDLIRESQHAMDNDCIKRRDEHTAEETRSSRAMADSFGGTPVSLPNAVELDPLCSKASCSVSRRRISSFLRRSDRM